MSNLDKLSKEDRKHVEILYQLKRNEAFLAAISSQLSEMSNDSINLEKFISKHIQKSEKGIKSIIDRLSK